MCIIIVMWYPIPFELSSFYILFIRFSKIFQFNMAAISWVYHGYTMVFTWYTYVYLIFSNTTNFREWKWYENRRAW